jgi:hypothetical protein
MDIDEFLSSEAGKFDKSAAPKAVIKSGDDESSSKESPMIEQIDKLRELLQRNKFKEAGDLYLQVKEKFSKITKQHVEEKTFIHDELADINDKLTQSINQQFAEMAKNKEMIENIIIKAEVALQQKDIIQAEALYKQVEVLFKAIPEIFTEQRLTLENKLLNISSKLTLEKTKKTIAEFETKKKEIEVLLDQAFNHINVGRLDLAKKVYIQVNKLYESLPHGFIYDKLLLYKKMLKIYKEAELSLEIRALQAEEKAQASLQASLSGASQISQSASITAPSPMISSKIAAAGQAPPAPRITPVSKSISAAPAPSQKSSLSSSASKQVAKQMKMPPLPAKK